MVARVSRREGRYGFNAFGGARNQGENPPSDGHSRWEILMTTKNLRKKLHLTVLQATPEQQNAA